ncbi:major facilitator superfamily domain-containing protein [Lyophyllum atratum]|nr:major facilitator superfamily domain-containing protein [Lyophyllum atratum]
MLDKEKESFPGSEKQGAESQVDRSSLVPGTGSPEWILAETKLVRKLDTRMLPAIVVIYIMNFIDRTNITGARLQGIQEDLNLTDIQYATVIGILFASYCPAQVPSNMLLNYIKRPSLYIGTCVILWGLTSALTGITKDFGGILACRIFVGLPEAAFYPGAMYLLSSWYTKKELALRSAILCAGLLISNAFGSLIAAGILSNMEGKQGIRAWRWLFFIEGAMTIAVGIVSIWLLPDYPNNTRWLSQEERWLAQARLSDDAGEADTDSAEDSPMLGLKLAVKDPLVWLFSSMTVSQLLGLSFVQFFPTLTQTLGYSTTVTLLLAAPPWILATIICLLNAWHADKTGERFFHIAGWYGGVIVGFIISLSFALNLTWVSNTIPRPPAKRAAAMGIVNGCGNVGILMGSYTWKATWGPEYHQSMLIALGALVLSAALAFAIRQILIQKNKQLDIDEDATLQGTNRTRVGEAARLEGITFEEAMRRRKGFRYLY